MRVFSLEKLFLFAVLFFVLLPIVNAEETVQGKAAVVKDVALEFDGKLLFEPTPINVFVVSMKLSKERRK